VRRLCVQVPTLQSLCDKALNDAAWQGQKSRPGLLQ
jgi:hypothetical protein